MHKAKLLLSVILFSTLTACGGESVSQVISSKQSTEVDAKGYELYRYTNIINNYETTFAKLPYSYKQSSSKPGKVVRMDYKTEVYGKEFDRYLNVYLPYGYNQEDTTKKYNVIYFQHGDKRSQDTLVTAEDQNTECKIMLDNLFDPDLGGITPSIIVFPTLYLAKDMSLAADNGKNGIPANLPEEYIQNILPLVEGTYNTYTSDTSDTGLQASRDHRAFTGYSRGAIFTWRMFQEKLDYFRWWAPMSCKAYPTGTTFSDVQTSKENVDEAAYQSIKSTVDSHKARNFYIYASTGNKNDMPEYRTQMNYFVNHQDSLFSYGLDPNENNIYFSVSKFEHTDVYVPYYYYNSLQVIFK